MTQTILTVIGIGIGAAQLAIAAMAWASPNINKWFSGTLFLAFIIFLTAFVIEYLKWVKTKEIDKLPPPVGKEELDWHIQNPKDWMVARQIRSTKIRWKLQQKEDASALRRQYTSWQEACFVLAAILSLIAWSFYVFDWTPIG